MLLLLGAGAEGNLHVTGVTNAGLLCSVVSGCNDTVRNGGGNVGAACATCACLKQCTNVLAVTSGLFVSVPLLGGNDSGETASSTGATATVTCATACGDNGLVAVEGLAGVLFAVGALFVEVKGVGRVNDFQLGDIVVIDLLGLC